ncbi:hypothetical protein [Mycobacterium xenopi]|uniref:hypothetical protein n=1 Tax=Mycobacterium xenopi TaxID=1789 RepID=UPI000304C8ED|nr:hypothetical protein [Mycobacterium xenopi]
MNLDDTGLRAAYYCAAEALRHRRLTGAPIPAWLRTHFDRLATAIQRASESRHESGCGEQQSEPDGWLTARQAAPLLGLSKRQTQRLAADLDGQLVDGRWLFPASTVHDYAQGRQRKEGEI